MTIEERFWPKVKIGGPSECWPWIGAKRPLGYGVLVIKKKGVMAHRISYLLANGELPREKYICHHCDNPPCVNPAHLFAGDADDNAKDAARKGRMPNHPRKEANWKMPPFIPWKTVQAIRAARKKGEYCPSIANRLGLSIYRVRSISQGTTYLSPCRQERGGMR